MRTTCNGLTGFDSLTFRQVEGNTRARLDGACVAGIVRCWNFPAGSNQLVYGGRGVNGYMLDCESGVAGSIPVDHPMGV